MSFVPPPSPAPNNASTPFSHSVVTPFALPTPPYCLHKNSLCHLPSQNRNACLVQYIIPLALFPSTLTPSSPLPYPHLDTIFLQLHHVTCPPNTFIPSMYNVIMPLALIFEIVVSNDPPKPLRYPHISYKLQTPAGSLRAAEGGKNAGAEQKGIMGADLMCSANLPDSSSPTRSTSAGLLR